VHLFLSQKGIVSSKHVAIINQIAEEIRLPFTLYIDSLSKGQLRNIDWWVSSPMSRDNLTSPLFGSCCSLILLQKLLKKETEIKLISTDSFVLKKVIKIYLKKNGFKIPVVYEKKITQRLTFFISPFLRWLWVFFKQFCQWVLVNKVVKKNININHDPLTLIDTYIAGDFDEKKDRYYGDLWDNLDKNEQDTLYFVPTIINDQKNSSKERLLKMSESKKNFLFKENFLKFSDYLYLILYPLRITFLNIPQQEFMKFEITPLIRSELKSMNAYDQICIALLNYRFAYRLKNSNVRLRLVVNWFENQILDKGWNAGFRTFFPKTATLGYAGYLVPLNWLARYPSEGEFQAKVIPERICVIGQELVKRTKMFCQNLEVSVAPAFRFEGVWDERKEVPNKKTFTVLVALPILVKDAVDLLRIVAESIKTTKIINLQVEIKTHPTLLPEIIKKTYDAHWPSKFKFVKGDFNNCVERSQLLISTASSVCVETLAKGIAVIVVGSQTGLAQNPIPETITSDIWQLCYTPEEMTKAIEFYAFRKEKITKKHEKTGEIIRKNYFEPVTRDSIYNFLKYS
jgi:hypothetical protein